MIDTFYPDASPETSTFDGKVGVAFGTNLDWTTIHDAADAGSLGGGFASTNTSDLFLILGASGTASFWNSLVRGMLLFDTSAIPDGDVIVSASLNLYTDNITDGFTDTLEICAATPASNTTIVTDDYDQFGTTSFGSVALSSLISGAVNSIPLNAAGIATLNKAGITKFGLRFGKDLNNDSTWIAGTPNSVVQVSTADNATPARRPFLSVTHVAPAFPPMLLRPAKRKKTGPRSGLAILATRGEPMRTVVIPTGTVVYAVPICKTKRPEPVQRTKRQSVLTPVGSTVKIVPVARPKPLPAITRKQRTPVIMPATVTVAQSVPIARTKQRGLESRRSRGLAPLPGSVLAPLSLPAKQRRVVELRTAKRTGVIPSRILVPTPLVLSKTRTRVPEVRGQKRIMSIQPVPKQNYVSLGGKTKTRIELRGRRVIAQFPAPLRNVPILMPPRQRRMEVTRRQRKVTLVSVRAPGLPIVVSRVRNQTPGVRSFKRMVPLSLPARQTPLPMGGKTRRVVESRRQRVMAPIPIRLPSSPIPLARRVTAGARFVGITRVKLRPVPLGPSSGATLVVSRKVATRPPAAVSRVKLRAIPGSAAVRPIVLPGKKQRTVETRTVRRTARFPGTASNGASLVMTRKLFQATASSPRPQIKLKALPSPAVTVTKPVPVARRGRLQTIVVRRSGVKVVPVLAAAKSIVVHTTKKTW